MKVGLALGGGGLRGIAHIGVIKALESMSVTIDIVTGASIGALVASLYAFNYSPDEMLKIARQIRARDLYDPDLLGFILGLFTKRFPEGFLRGKKLEKWLYSKFGRATLAMSSKTLGIVATDINSGDLVVFDSVSDCCKYDLVVDAVRASSSIPGVFQPKVVPGLLNSRGQECKLVDGGVKNNVPADVARFLGADRVIAVDLGYVGQADEGIDSLIEIVVQSVDIIGESLMDHVLAKNADIVINPRIYNVKLTDFHRIDEIYERGYEACVALKDEILGLVG